MAWNIAGMGQGLEDTYARSRIGDGNDVPELIRGQSDQSHPGSGRHWPGPSSSPVAGALPALLAGCLLVGASSTFIKLSGATSDTAALLRCALALIVFVPASIWEWRRHGLPPLRMIMFGLAAGLFLGWDYTMWTQSILDSGASVATVLIGVQVVAFPLLTRVLVGERVQRRFLVALPVMIIGLVLTGRLAAADRMHRIRCAVPFWESVPGSRTRHISS